MKTKFSYRFLLFLLLQTATITVVYAQGVVINGVRWATSNVDKPGTFAANPQDAGMFYEWNSVVGWSSTDPLISSDGRTEWEELNSSGDTWTSDNDPCPAGWRVPTKEEFESLLKSKRSWKTVNGVKGWQFGKDENKIFLPAVSCRQTSRFGKFEEFKGKYSFGFYWSGSVDNESALFLFLPDEFANRLQLGKSNRANACCIRCVAVEPLNQ